METQEEDGGSGGELGERECEAAPTGAQQSV